MDNKSVKENISRIRRRQGLSQEEMAERMGISRTAYRHIEHGPTRLISDSIGKAAEILGVSAEEILLGYVPEKEVSNEISEMKVRYGSRLRELESGHADELNRIKAHIGLMSELVSSLQENLRTKDEIISMLRKGIAGQNTR